MISSSDMADAVEKLRARYLAYVDTYRDSGGNLPEMIAYVVFGVIAVAFAVYNGIRIRKENKE